MVLYGLNVIGWIFLIFRVRVCGFVFIVFIDVEMNVLVSFMSEFIFGNKDNIKCEFKVDIFIKFFYLCLNFCNDFNEYWILWGDDNDDLI